MKISKKRVVNLLIILMFLVSVILTGCSSPKAKEPSTPTATSQKERVLTIAYDRDPELLDPIKTAWYSDALLYVFDRLVSRDYDFKYKPGLAESWDTSDDGLNWTFHLRKDVKFHDGKVFDADDVKWTFDTIKDPKTASPFAGDLAAIKSVTVQDKNTVVFSLNYPYPNLLFNLSNTAAGIAEKDAYQKYGADYGTKKVIGTGPYMLQEWVKGDKVVLVKNPDYQWGPEWMSNKGPALIEKIVMRSIPEENTRIMELQSGGVNLITEKLPTNFIEQLKKDPNIEIVQGDATKLGYLAYATDKKPFTDLKVRQAINYAINRKDIIDYIFNGYASEAYGYLPSALKDEYYKNSDTEGYHYDPAKAKQLLADAGYGKGLKLTLSADNSTLSKRLTEVLQNQLKQVGIETEIQLYDSSSYTAMLKDGKQELFLREYSWPNADILDWFLVSKQAPYPNHSRWQDKTTDDMIQKAGTMPTWNERATEYQKLQKYLIEQAVWAPIYIPKNLMAVRKDIVNFKYHPWKPFYNDGMDIKN